MRVGSPEYNALMAKWSNQAWHEEIERDSDTYYETHEGQLSKVWRIETPGGFLIRTVTGTKEQAETYARNHYTVFNIR